MRSLTYAQAINEALFQAMEYDDRVIFYGLGATDPKRIFGTTIGLTERFGADRVFDTPVSENAMTGVGIGAALSGLIPVMCHQRVDFFLLAMEQLINNAAKWHYMFGSNSPVPVTIRLVVGRGWGQGPTHSQNIHSMFSHVPGLKVVSPSTARDAKGMLLSAIFDPNPVVFLEHRWLHNQQGEVPENPYLIPIGPPRKVSDGDKITIVSMSYMTVEAIKATEYLKKEYKLTPDHFDLRSMKPINYELIYESVKKTGRLLVLDTGHESGSLAGDVITKVVESCWGSLDTHPVRITIPDIPTPTSFGLTKHFYPDFHSVIRTVLKMTGLSEKPGSVPPSGEKHDIPGEWFQGPF